MRVHPRVRGGADVEASDATRATGPSPRARGSRRVVDPRQGCAGSIPACAGEPRSRCRVAGPSGVHPRVRGGADPDTSACPLVSGPSPRARGSRRCARPPSEPLGSIPACAGEPPARRQRTAPCWVHPRVRGGATAPGNGGGVGMGPSPRARGSHVMDGLARGALGSIPACAGEPPRITSWPHLVGVHPRVRGGACFVRTLGPRLKGPSPRARGSPQVRRCEHDAVGSIPACAGEPRPVCAAIPPPKVHPRVRGGANVEINMEIRRGGPSPRARGSRHHRRARHARMGSIPACAGEPPSGTSSPWTSRVHPRVRGGAAAYVGNSASYLGPSPRARGSRGRHHGPVVGLRSIPACAGEPHRTHRPAAPCWVHPRVRGGAVRVRALGVGLDGPSPRARGSLGGAPLRHARRGSIPACAGEPTAATNGCARARVHPRVRGGAYPAPNGVRVIAGPSPRARGSHATVRGLDLRVRSIPACAGEPASSLRSVVPPRVHPRVRGGAMRTCDSADPTAGPSPRARGSLLPVSRRT